VADETAPVPEADSAHGDHAGIHLPPPSLVPINVALALATTLVGFVDQIRNAVGGLVWGIGLAWLIGSCAIWFLAARHEYEELPESLEGH
jgi:hypothetical protein